MHLPCRFGRYTLVEKIASGGTAEIYRARLDAQEGFSKTLAIKRLLPSWCTSEELVRMLKDEARVLCLLPHQSIVQVHELGTEGGAPFLAMEYVHGIDCARLINRLIRDRSPMPPQHALYIIEQVLLALEFAHRCKDADGKPMGLVHRDVSPSNILLSWNGEVKVTDFGIAKGLHRSERTDAGQIRGKYSYMSPEQARGEPIDARTDIFAAGIVLYELLSARRLFACRCEYETLQMVAKAEFSLEGMKGMPAELRALAMLAMAKDPSGRFHGAGEMLSELRSAMRSLNFTGSSLDLAAYLKDLFPEEIARERSASSFRVEGQPTRRMTALRGRALSRLPTAIGYAWRLAAMASILTATTAFAPMPKGAAIVARPAEAGEERADRPPALKGMIAIESLPSGAKGFLRIGKESREITTPFTISGIDLNETVQGRVELRSEGFEPVSEDFSISPESAAFVKSFSLRRMAAAKLSVAARPWGLVTVPGYASGRETPFAALDVKPGSYMVQVVHPPTGRVLKRGVALPSGASRRCVAIFEGEPGISCR